MKCKELTNDLLLDFSDWRLAPQERSQVAQHLEGCPPCQGRLDDTEVMAGALKNVQEAPPPALLRQLDAAVLGRVTARAVQPFRPVRQWLFAGAAVAAILTVAISAWVFLPISAGTPTPTPVFVTSPPLPSTPSIVPPGAGASSSAKATEDKTEDRPAPPPAKALVRVEARPEEPKKPIPPLVIPRLPAPPALATKPPAAPKVGAAAAPRRGDLNGDGRVDIADARAIYERIERGEELPAHADVTGNGIADVADAREIQSGEVRGE